MKTFARFFLIAILYFVAAWFGMESANYSDKLAVVWPASGLTVAAFWIWGGRLWPAVFLADFLFSATIAGSAPGRFHPGWLVTAAGNTFGPLLGVWLLRRRIDGRSIFHGAENMVAFLLLGAGFSCLLSATLVSLGLVWQAPALAILGAHGIGPMVFLGDLIAVLSISPMLIAWHERRGAPFLEGRRREGIYLFASLLLFHYVVFFVEFRGGVSGGYPLGMAFMVFTSWAAFRLKARSFTTVIFFVSAFAIAATLNGYGPFAGRGIREALLPIQGFIGVMSIASLILHAVVCERERAEESLLDSQEALRQANVDLEQRVEERVSELREALEANEKITDAFIDRTRDLNKALEDLGRAERRYRALYENAMQGMFQSSFEGRYITVNPAMANILGYGGPDELAGIEDLGATIYFSPADRAAWVDELRLKGEIVNRDVLFKSRDGTPVWGLISARILPDEDGRPIIEGIIIDNTSRKVAEENLRRSEARYRSIIETTLEGFLLTDPAMTVTDVNDALCELLGYARDELLGRHPADLTPENQNGFWDRALREEDATGHIVGETAFVHRDGREIPVLFTGSVIPDDQGGVGARIGFLTDITELKEAEALREDVDRIMRHDLKTPLTAIINAPRLLRMNKDLPEPHRRLLDAVENSGYRMLNMVNLSLDLFKMETGAYELVAKNVDILPIVRRVCEELERTAHSMKVDMEIQVGGRPAGDGDSLVILGDEMLCYSMLANLIKNALEASPHGEKLQVRLSCGDCCRIDVHNMGVVPESIRDRFFEKYATAGKKSGTGLGTYSARLIAETQNGRISFTTSEEDGTTVTVELPAGTGGETA